MLRTTPRTRCPSTVTISTLSLPYSGCRAASAFVTSTFTSSSKIKPLWNTNFPNTLEILHLKTADVHLAYNTRQTVGTPRATLNATEKLRFAYRRLLSFFGLKPKQTHSEICWMVKCYESRNGTAGYHMWELPLTDAERPAVLPQLWL